MALVGSAVRRVLEWLMMVLIIDNILHTHATETIKISISNGGQWGSWGPAEYCPDGSYVYGFDVKMEGWQLAWDDTALNGIKLYCKSAKTSKLTGDISSTVQKWGSWQGRRSCSGLFMVAFTLKVEMPQESGDDTAANSLIMKCQNNKEHTHSYGGIWGNYGLWDQCPSGYAICGLRTKVEQNQNSGDDTALNSVEMYCCSL